MTQKKALELYYLKKDVPLSELVKSARHQNEAVTINASYNYSLSKISLIVYRAILTVISLAGYWCDDITNDEVDYWLIADKCEQMLKAREVAL